MPLFTNIQSELLNQIESAEKCLKIAVTWFTNHDLFEALLRKLEDPAFQVELIVLNDRINNKAEGINFQRLINKNGNFYYSYIEQMVHHKFCIIDDRLVITGSYNWTYHAENRNWENIVTLDEPKIIEAYISEFQTILNSHSKVLDIASKQLFNAAINANEYLEVDYLYQAISEEKKGNDREAGRIYTEVIKLNNKQTEAIDARNKIVEKYNKQLFEVSPFEIGIEFRDGYAKVIPACSPLPFNTLKKGYAVADGQTKVNVIIQKNDLVIKTMDVFTFQGLKPSLKGTELVHYELSLSKHGILHIRCIEVNGYSIRKTFTIDIKNHM